MKLHHNGDRIRLKTRQETTQLVSGDEFFGDGGWQCVADGCWLPYDFLEAQRLTNCIS